MCILFVANQQRKDMPLIIAANRDEFYRRPTLPSHFWSDAPDMLAGKDLEAGGSWMGVTRQGRIAAITNVRAANAQRDNAKSRGELVTQSLCDPNHQTLSRRLRQSRDKYQGYNLLFGDINALQVYNNIEDRLHDVSPGIHGLSNATLNAPWPKVTRGMQSLSEYCQHSECIVPQDLFELLRNDEQADDDRLPDTGISKEWEKRLSSIFIQSPDYGTRASTIILVSQDLQLYWHERQFSPEGAILSEVTERFQLAGE